MICVCRVQHELHHIHTYIHVGSLPSFPILDLTEDDYKSLADAESATVELPSSVLLGNGTRKQNAFVSVHK